MGKVYVKQQSSSNIRQRGHERIHSGLCLETNKFSGIRRTRNGLRVFKSLIKATTPISCDEPALAEEVEREGNIEKFHKRKEKNSINKKLCKEQQAELLNALHRTYK